MHITSNHWGPAKGTREYLIDFVSSVTIKAPFKPVPQPNIVLARQDQSGFHTIVSRCPKLVINSIPQFFVAQNFSHQPSTINPYLLWHIDTYSNHLLYESLCERTSLLQQRAVSKSKLHLLI